MGEVKAEFKQNLSKGSSLLDSGATMDAIPYLEKAYKLNPENLDAALNFGAALILSKKFRRAREVLELAAIVHPDQANIWVNLGAARLGNPVLADDSMREEAIISFKKALEISPDAPSVAYNIGLVYRDRKDYSSALDWFERAIETNPKDRDAISLAVEMSRLIDDQ